MIFLKIEIYLMNLKKIFENRIYFEQNLFFQKLKLEYKLSNTRVKLTSHKVFGTVIKFYSLLNIIENRNRK